jgi:hypothetical protein
MAFGAAAEIPVFCGPLPRRKSAETLKNLGSRFKMAPLAHSAAKTCQIVYAKLLDLK